MACYLNTTVYLPDDLLATVRARVRRKPQGDALRALANEILAVSGPQKRGMIRSIIASAVASQLVTCDQSEAVNGTDKLTIAGTDLSVVASPATESQVSKGTSDAEFAANVVAKINAHSTISKLVWAAVTTSASGIFTIYAIVPGPIGNLITLAETGDGFTLGASALAGGASDAVDAYQLGYNTPAHVAG
jgi:hypothetical protein